MKTKLKTKKSLLRRVKITGTGKIFHGSNFKRHLIRNKSKSQLRRLKRLKTFSKAFEAKIRDRLGIA